MTPMLATGWNLDPDGSKVTIGIRNDVSWNAPRGFEDIDFGMFTARDATDWLNLSNPTTNPESQHYLGGWWRRHYGEARVVDDFTMVRY